MANAALENLSAATTVAGTDLVPIKQAGATLLKGTVNQLATGILSGDAVASAGTANGVLFLNGSKVATSGGALTFDGSGLFGLGRAVSSYSPLGARSVFEAFKTTVGAGFLANFNDTTKVELSAFNGVAWLSVATNHPLIFGVNNGEVGRFTAAGQFIRGASSADAISAESATMVNIGNFAVQNAPTSGTYFAVKTEAANGKITLVADARTGAYPALGFKVGGAERGVIDASGNFIHQVNATAPTLSTNGTMSFELTSDTSLKIVVRGSDNVTRSVSLTLA